MQRLQIYVRKQLPQQHLPAADRAVHLKRQQFARSTALDLKMLTAEIHV
jgi:hypothetical protein